jgi:hypothetical protein
MLDGLKALTGLLGVFVSLPAVSADCSSPVVLDQSFVAQTSLGADINEGFDLAAQTFTAGVSGHLVGVSVDVFGFSETLPRISLYKGVSGFPTSDLLGSVLWSSPSAELTDVIDLTSQSVRVKAGQTYVLAVDYPGPPRGAFQSQGIWSGSANGGYISGGAFFGNFSSGDSGPVAWFTESGVARDLFFKTYVKGPDFDSLLSDVEGVGPGSSLADKINLAKTYCESGDDYREASCAVLAAFVNQVGAQRGKKLTADLADTLAADAQALITAIGCN